MFGFPLGFDLKIFAYYQQVKSNLLFAVFFNTILDLFLGNINPPSFTFILINEYWAWLQTVQLIERSFVRDITHKMINIRLFLFLFLVLFKDKRFRTTETIMKNSDGLGIAKG